MQPSNQNKRSLLESRDKGVDTAQNPPARLWRLLLKQLNMHPWRWTQLLDQYLANPRNGIPNNPRDRSSARGNLNKELFKPKLTFTTLLRGLTLLSPRKVKFELHCTWDNGATTVTSVDVMVRRMGESAVNAMPDDIDEMLGTGSVDPSAVIQTPPDTPTTVMEASSNPFANLQLPPLPVPGQFQPNATGDDNPPWQEPTPVPEEKESSKKRSK